MEEKVITPLEKFDKKNVKTVIFDIKLDDEDLRKKTVSLNQALEIAISMDKQATSLNKLCGELMLENKELKIKVKNLTIAVATTSILIFIACILLYCQ